jgi:hypothetical protein
MARMKKVDLVAKIAKEQGLDPAKLERMPRLELEKMDKVVPDSAGSDILGDDAPVDPVSPSGDGADSVVAQGTVLDDSGLASAPDAGADDSADQVDGSEDGSQEISSVKAPEGKVCIGNHPVTGKPVYE